MVLNTSHANSVLDTNRYLSFTVLLSQLELVQELRDSLESMCWTSFDPLPKPPGSGNDAILRMGVTFIVCCCTP